MARKKADDSTAFHDGTLTISPWAEHQRGHPQKVPTELGDAVDLLWTMDAQRKEYQRKADIVEKAENELKEILIKYVQKQRLAGAVGKLGKVRVEKIAVPTIKDFDALWTYIFKTKDKTLLQRRLSADAVKERWEENKAVPGVEPFEVTKIFITKA